MIEYQFVKQLNTTNNSIFYSIINYEDQVIGFGRKHFSQSGIKTIIMDMSFNIIEDNDKTILSGEDPRCFVHKNILYIQDNTFSNMKLIKYNNDTVSRIGPIRRQGKNITFISHNENLYYIHWMKPFIMYKLDTDTMTDIQITPLRNSIHTSNEANNEYRGGTPGYKLSENEYFGFGHRTYNSRIEKEPTVIHDIFYWKLTFHDNDNDIPSFQTLDIPQPPNSLNICDPTSVIMLNNKMYLITAESNLPWFSENGNKFVNNVYEINILYD